MLGVKTKAHCQIFPLKLPIAPAMKATIKAKKTET